MEQFLKLTELIESIIEVENQYNPGIYEEYKIDKILIVRKHQILIECKKISTNRIFTFDSSDSRIKTSTFKFKQHEKI